MDTVTRQDHIQLLQGMPIFGGIRADTLAFLLHQANYVRVPKGACYYHEGDPAHSLFVLESGRILMLKRWQGHDYKLKMLERGDCFGEVALIDLQPRNTSTLAIEDCCAIELSDTNLYQLYQRELEQYTLISMNMAREVCRRLREADERAFAADMQARRLTGNDTAG